MKMKARICDKCKNIIEHHPAYLRGRTPKIYAIVTNERRWKDDCLVYTSIGKTFDICEDCLKDLYKYMEGDNDEN